MSISLGRTLAWSTVSSSWVPLKARPPAHGPLFFQDSAEKPPLRGCWADPTAAGPLPMPHCPSQDNRVAHVACSPQSLFRCACRPSYKHFTGFSFSFSKMGFIIYKLVCKNFPFHLLTSLGDPSTQGFGGLPHHCDVPIGTVKMKRLASPSAQEDVEKTKFSITSVETNWYKHFGDSTAVPY